MPEDTEQSKPSIFNVIEMPDADTQKAMDKLALLELMAEGKTMTQACREIGITRVTVWRWRNEDSEFSTLYDDAHKAMAVALADDALTVLKDLADGSKPATKEQVQAASAYSQRASWYASKLLPKVYGDQTQPKQVNNFNAPVAALVCDEQGRQELIALRRTITAQLTEGKPNEVIQQDNTQPATDSDSVEETE